MQSTAVPHPTTSADAAAQTVRTRRRTAAQALYAFDDCTPACMIRICRLLHDRGFRGESTLYVMPHTHRFYLSVEEPIPAAGKPLPPTLLLEEFGVRIASASMLCCLGEHARCICAHNAVASLAALDLP